MWRLFQWDRYPYKLIQAFLIGIPYFFKIRSLQGSPCAREMCVLFATGRHLEYFIMMAEGHNGEGFAVSKLSPPLSSFHEVVKEKIEVCRWTHKQVSDYLQQLYPGSRGHSVRNLERFCSEADIHRTSRLDQSLVDGYVSEAIQKVCLHKVWHCLFIQACHVQSSITL